jgi:hypothetical protein
MLIDWVDGWVDGWVNIWVDGWVAKRMTSWCCMVDVNMLWMDFLSMAATEVEEEMFQQLLPLDFDTL